MHASKQLIRTSMVFSTRHNTTFQPIMWVVLIVLLVVFFLLDLSCGSVWISLSQLWNPTNPIDVGILLNLRLPRAITALLAGIALSVSGLLVQTLFANPLAGPYTLGVSNGAGLGVAIVTMCATTIGTQHFVVGNVSIVFAAIVGSTIVLMIVIGVAKFLRDNVSLLIVGMMFGSIAGAVVNLLQNFANPDALKLFVVWTLGSLTTVGWNELPIFAIVLILGIVFAFALIKPLNGMMLGEQYARGLGISMQRLRVFIVIATGLLAGGVTAFCGPIAFIGVAVPHLARGLFATANHRTIMPATAIIGAILLLLCDILTSLFTYPLPISTVSALFGAPIIIAIILRNK